MKKSLTVFLTLLFLLQSFAVFATGLPGGDFQMQSNNDPYGWTLYGGASHVPKTWDVSLPGIVPNGDFESVSGASFDDWSIYRSQYASVSTEIKYGGTSALHFSKQTNHAKQNIKLKPDTDYILSARVYMANTTTASTSITLTYFAADGGEAGTGDGLYPSDTFNTWQTLSYKIHTAQNVDYATIYIRYDQTGGDFYYDDVTLYEVAQPDFSFDTKEVFFYADEETGEATVFGNGMQGNEKVTFTLSYLGKKIDTKEVSFSDGKAVYSFPLSLMSQIKKEYELSAKVFRESGEVKAFSERIYKYPRPLALSKDGVYRIGGKPFYPVVGYHVYGDDYKRMEEIGVNVVQVAASVTEEQLDSFLEHNVMALVCLYSGVPQHMKPGGHPENQDVAIQTIERLKDHPAVFGWAVQDEPFWLGSLARMDEWVKDTYKLVRDRDDKLPVYICQAPAQYYPLAAKYCDILACDPYPYSEDSKKVTTQTEMCVRSAKSNKPVYSIVQTYSTNAPPSADFIRQQVYRSFESGAKGIGYYSLSDAASASSSPIYNFPETWNGLAAFAENELPHLFEIFTNPAGTAWDSANETDVYSQYYRAALSKDGTVVYAALHNRSNSETTVTLPVPAKYTVQRVEKTGTAAGNSSYTAILGAQRAALYKFTLLSSFSDNQLPQLTKPILSPFVYSSSYNTAEENMYVSLPTKGASVSTRVYNLKPYTSYQLELSYKVSKKNALRLQVSYYVQDENGFSRWTDFCKAENIPFIEKEAKYTERFGTAEKAGGEWRRVRFDFYTPQNCNAAYIELDAYSSDVYAAVDDVVLMEGTGLNLLKNGSLDFLTNENTLCGGWFSYNEYMNAYGNVKLVDGYIEMKEHTENNSANLRQNVYLYEGQTYKLSFDFLGQQPDISIWNTAQKANTVTEWGETASSWKRYSVYFVVDETSQFCIWFGGKNTKGTYCYDNICLEPVETDGPEFYREVGETVDGGCMNSVCLPFTGIQGLNTDVLIIDSNKDGKLCWLSVGTYTKENKLFYFDSAKGQSVLKLRIPKEYATEDIRLFLWNEKMMPY